MERKEKTQWEKNAIYVNDTYGAYVNWEDRFYECPECGEPVYEDDWSERELRQYLCPICEDCDGEEDWYDEDEDFLDEDWEDEADETGFDPYMGCYSDDC